jgi:restriction endonuclease Mrr
MATQHLGDPGDSDLRERSIGELLRQLSEQTTRLVHQELELAKAELTHKGKQATPLVPEQTIETVKEDVEWAKTQMRSEKT